MVETLKKAGHTAHETALAHDDISGTDIADTKLSRETLDRIDALLVRHEWKGKNRGLYTHKELREVRQKLLDLAVWLERNEPRFLREADAHYTHHSRFNEKTVLCISYVDHIALDDDRKAAAVLRDFFNTHLAGLYSHLHILPHFPSPIIHGDLKGPASRADGGFEAENYWMDMKFGTPEELDQINAGLMFDFVLNHLSTKGEWFEKFLENEPGYENFFVTVPADQVETMDLSPVFRPREHDPIVPYTNSKGETKYVWCTFSETQADLNLKEPAVFYGIMEALIKGFIGQGASWIRLDAVGYLIKMLGLEDREMLTSCFGIVETHNLLKMMRAYLNDIAPSVTLVPEVNARGEIIETYYGCDNDEGHLVYEFPSAPLSLFSIYAEDATAILEWSEGRNKNPEWIGLAFTSSHDGIGVLPMEDVADMQDGASALSYLIHQIERRGGGVNYKSKIIDGENVRVPYEACITWMQAILTPPERAALKGNRMSDAEIDLVVDRYMASQSFIYSAPHCVPADYMGVIASLLNDEDLYEAAGHRRNKNRGLINETAFNQALNDPQTAYDKLVQRVFMRKNEMIRARQTNPAFSPYALCDVDVVSAEGAPAGTRPVYSVLRHSPHCPEEILALTNCTDKAQTVFISKNLFGEISCDHVTDLLGAHETCDVSSEGVRLTMKPYQVSWIRIAKG